MSNRTPALLMAELDAGLLHASGVPDAGGK